MFNIFANEEPHTSINPENLFEIFGLPITNAILYGWISAIFIIWLFFAARKRIKIGGHRSPAEILEVGTEFIIGILEQSLASRKLALKYAPIFVTLFFFILLNNWLGLLPGVGMAIQYDGQPLLRGFTADLNATYAMAIFGMVLVQIIAIRENGGYKHVKHYFPGSFFNPVTYLVGAFEILTEFTRLLSLGLRLFLNIAIGEVLIAVAAYLGSGLAPLTALPFTMLEILVGILQAFIFVVLCIAYLSATLAQHGDHQEEHA